MERENGGFGKQKKIMNYLESLLEFDFLVYFVNFMIKEACITSIGMR